MAALAYLPRLYSAEGWEAVCPVMLVATVIVFVPMPAWVRLAAAAVFGVGIRLLAHDSFGGFAFPADAAANEQMSNHVAAGSGLWAEIPKYGHLRAAYPPLYPLLLGGFKWLGGGALLLNMLLNLAGAALVRRLSGSDRAAAAFFLFPSVVIASLAPLKESLALALFLLAVLTVERPLLYGAIAGLIALAQPAWAPLPVIAFALVHRWRPRAYLAAALGGIAVMLPWWVRNWLLFGQFIPLTSSTGLGLSVAVTGQWLGTGDIALDELGRSAELGRRALAIMAADPIGYLILRAKEAALALALDDDAIRALSWSGRAWLNAAAWGAQVCWITLLAFAARATIPAGLKPFLWAGLINIAMFGVWLEFSDRHRAWAVPLLLLLVSRQQVSWPFLAKRPSPPS